VARVVLLLVLAALALPAAASAATRSEANAQAKRAANRYTNTQFGIRGATRDWKASCHGFSTHWLCAVSFNAGECRGFLRLRNATLRPYGYRIGCVE
jgi:hypothetical protein